MPHSVVCTLTCSWTGLPDKATCVWIVKIFQCIWKIKNLETKLFISIWKSYTGQLYVYIHFYLETSLFHWHNSYLVCTLCPSEDQEDFCMFLLIILYCMWARIKEIHKIHSQEKKKKKNMERKNPQCSPRTGIKYTTSCFHWLKKAARLNLIMPSSSSYRSSSSLDAFFSSPPGIADFLPIATSGTLQAAAYRLLYFIQVAVE